MSTLEKVALFHQAFKIETPTEKAGIPRLPALTPDVRTDLRTLAFELRVLCQKSFVQSASLRRAEDPAFCIFLRLQLIFEETAEVMEAIANDDISATAHELADLDYVVMGTILNLGLGLVHNRVVDEIHRANMTKLDNEGRPVLNEAGRVVKSPNFKRANVSDIVRGD